MRVNTKDPITGSSTGASAEVVLVDDSYTQTRVTINGLTTGTATVRAKALGSDGFEDVEDSTLTLSSQKTLIIGSSDKGALLESIEITVSAGTAYDYYISQQ